jgi:uridylate kinase
VRIAIVVGGGNIFRGLGGAADGMDRTRADTMGMLATVINAIALQDAFERRGIVARAMSALEMERVCDTFVQRRAVAYLDAGEVLVLGAGTSNPYFTTDTAAALRALELGADVVMKATKVDGVYDKDPVLHADAVRFERLTYMDVLRRGLRIMDGTAVSLCQENGLPIVVFDMLTRGNIRRVVCGEPLGTTVGADGTGKEPKHAG